MGKKGDRKRAREETEDEDEIQDPELQAEIAAIMAMKEEQKQSQNGDGEEQESKPKASVYNKDAMMQLAESMGVDSMPFIENMQISEYELAFQDENDDLEREMAFYNHAILAVKYGRDQFAKLGIPFQRPDDYFCESVKSDAHMARVKDRLILEEKKIDAFEQRKQRELNRKFNKQVSAQRREEKARDKKLAIESAKKMRGGEDAEDKEKPGVKRDGKKTTKRIAMDKKYGFGAKERKKAKLNDKKSLNDFSDYNPRGGKLIRREKRGGGAGGKGGKKGGNRPGKAARMERRANRSKSA
mmetsp:Transcript_15390/g.23187  ORF Transcript_15390/g.23187 Transcript_15390/m.23187 type:complete len:299 (+) Transcript_15390:71-967(+)|eukprot:CAMPEP_0185029770 /NCGR_PEP_ID=MMETSP1103-20130426/16270_1 /TAXON_ID=36769 /ORGANISM="Paraphysomonas bandaiensis, Strain Caron Lab Isolate" /LENGTH=298 /DNA_ID=CAMNT_0027564633 /DNA_START=6 /DNA_END=902 /DNA_ORIENTATION=+